LQERVLATLEFNKVLDRLAQFCSFSLSKEGAVALRPSTDYQEIVRRQRQTAEARRLLELKPDFSLGAARDIRELARQASLGHVLQPSELLDIAAMLSLAIHTGETVGRHRLHVPLLAEACGRIADFKPLLAELSRCLNQRAEVVDKASPILAELRIRVREAHDRLLKQLHRLIASPGGRTAIQEPLVTLRDGRYVIPVKAEMRSALPGIVHDVSSSGATLFLEPLSCVELGNGWRELQLEEEREVLRILRTLSALIGEKAGEVSAAVEAVAFIDIALAKAKLGEKLGCHELPQAGPDQRWLSETTDLLRMVGARHPLLAENATRKVVPLSVWLGRADHKESDSFTVLLVTGPNTGGKTVALKTIGLLALMAQAGLAVPAEVGSVLPVFDNVFADIGDEQSIEQSLSTFSSHMGNIIAALERLGPRSLVLLDELGAGTDPDEGAALAKAVLEHLLAVGCLTIATTHHGELKSFAHSTAGIMNAAVEFDAKTLEPTYRLSIGVPGQSNAFAIAQRLGLPSAILRRAEASMGAGQLEVESLIRDLQQERDAAAREHEAAGAEHADADALRREAQQRLETQDREQRLQADRALRAIEREAERARKRLAEATKTIEKALSGTPSQRKLHSLQRARAMIRSSETGMERFARKPSESPETLGDIQPGYRLWLRGISEPGQALTAPNEEGELQVALGALRATIRLEHIDRVEKAPAADHSSEGFRRPPRPKAMATPEVQVRGMTVEEALELVDRHLDAAAHSGAEALRIVHGKGTGTLRRAVRDMLTKHPLAHSYTQAAPREGGEGVTVVELAQ